MNFDFNHLYMTTDGRIGRQSFWMGILGLFVVALVVNLILWGLFGALSNTTRWLSFVLQLVLAYPTYALFAKRFQDRDKPGNYGWILVGASLLYSLLALFGLFGDPMAQNMLGNILGVVVFAVFVWFLIELGILRGTVGSNQYGPDPVA
jgi:uncharacterized membrane protein YhaH (DUF805 family)